MNELSPEEKKEYQSKYQPIVLRIKTLSDIWTGGVDIGTCSNLRTSGIMGSLRWWYELVVRALNGYACCPVKEPCSDKNGGKCAVCELFGCTGWSRKFKLRVEDTDGMVVKEQLKKNKEYLFRLIFSKAPKAEEEWLLLRLISKIIAPYGSIGGKMPNKPSEHAFNMANPKLAQKQDKTYHMDFGLFEVISISSTSENQDNFTKEQLKKYIDGFKVKASQNKGSYQKNSPTWPTLNHLFSIKGDFQSFCFDRKKIEDLLGLRLEYPRNTLAPGFCLQGDRGKSKNIFSFKNDRVWGYCKNDDQRVSIVDAIRAVLGSSITEEVVGIDFLDKKLFSSEGEKMEGVIINGGSNV